MSETNLFETLDSSFGDGPPQPPAHQRLVAGRRALLRRRLALTVSAAVVVTLGSTLVLASVGDRVPRVVDPAAPGRSSQIAPGADVQLRADGQLLSSPDVVVERQDPNPMGYEAPDHSLAVVFSRRGETFWALLTYEVPGDDTTASTASAIVTAATPGQPFEQWVADEIGAKMRMVGFDGDDDVLVAVGDSRILAQTNDVDLPDFVRRGDQAAAALVEDAGERWFVLARRGPNGVGEYFPTRGTTAGATLEDFLNYLDQQYDGKTPR